MIKEMTPELALLLLGDISLDLREYRRPFLYGCVPLTAQAYYSIGEQKVTFALHFERYSLPGSPLQVVRDPQVAQRIIAAIETNLAGEMFAAATELRRIEAERSDERRKLEKADRDYFADLKARGVIPEFTLPGERAKWEESPVAQHLYSQSPLALDDARYMAEYQRLARLAAPGVYGRTGGSGLYTDYVLALEAALQAQAQPA